MENILTLSLTVLPQDLIKLIVEYDSPHTQSENQVVEHSPTSCVGIPLVMFIFYDRS